jgi:hypothetical protein
MGGMKKTCSLLAALSLGLAACGGGEPPAADRGKVSAQDAQLAFARCMRENGVDMPDPQPGGGIVAKKGEAPAFDSSQFKAAEKECRKHTEAMEKKLGIQRSEG